MAGIQGVIPYYDDVLIVRKNEEDFMCKLREVLNRVRADGLRLKREKCIFGVRSIDFLGFNIDESGIRPLKSKVEAITKAPVPENKTELQAFLGLVNFYHTFLKNKATVAEKLHRLLDKNESWKWNEEHDRAFKNLKELLSSESFLAHYDESKHLILTCDASPY